MNATRTGNDSASASDQNFPLTKFAAVEGVYYALTNDRDPQAAFSRGGVMLSELAPGEYVIVVIGGSYDVTVESMFITADLDVHPDNRSLEVRLSQLVRSSETIKSWTHLQFNDRAVYTKFNRIFWAIFDDVTEKKALIHSRLHEVAYSHPSNFTYYCRQYLGEGYFDTLEESDSEEGSDHGDGDTVVGVEVEGEEVC